MAQTYHVKGKNVTTGGQSDANTEVSVVVHRQLKRAVLKARLRTLLGEL